LEDSLVDAYPLAADYVMTQHQGCVDQGGSVEKNLINSEISVFPNPAFSEITIEGSHILESYQLVDLSGKMILKGTAHSTQLILNLNSLSNGMYILSVIEAGQEVHRKIVKE
jgi:hypothetical protein